MKKYLLLILIPAVVHSQQLFKIEYNDTLLLLKKFSFNKLCFTDYELLYIKNDKIFKVKTDTFFIHNDTIPIDAPYHNNWWDTYVYDNIILRSTRFDSIVYPVYIEPDIPDLTYLYNIDTRDLFKVDSTFNRFTFYNNNYFACKSISIGDSVCSEVYINWKLICSIDNALVRFVNKNDALFLDVNYKSHKLSDVDSTAIWKFNDTLNNFIRIGSTNDKSSLKMNYDKKYSFVIHDRQIKIYDSFIDNLSAKRLFDAVITNYYSLTGVISYPSADTCFTDFYHNGKFIKRFTITNDWNYTPNLILYDNRLFTVLFKNNSVTIYENDNLLFFENDNRWYTYYFIIK